MKKRLNADTAELMAACGINGRNRQQRRQQQAKLGNMPHHLLPDYQRTSWRRVKKAIHKYTNGLPCGHFEHYIACDWLGVG
jgi:hypothetical protein